MTPDEYRDRVDEVLDGRLHMIEQLRVELARYREWEQRLRLHLLHLADMVNPNTSPHRPDCQGCIGALEYVAAIRKEVEG